MRLTRRGQVVFMTLGLAIGLLILGSLPWLVNTLANWITP